MAQTKKHDDDWAKGFKREHLDRERRRIWSEEQAETIARWLEIGRDQTIVDVGCGLGYLAYTLGPYFGAGCHYIGIDRSPALLREAEAMSWDGLVDAVFVNGRAEALPLADATADVVMCQTLLIHLPDPLAALAEMYRVLKPGGLIACLEPDNFRAMLIPHYTSLPEPSVDMMTRLFRARLIALQGRIKLGRGDYGIAPRIPGMLHELGVSRIEVRLRDSAALLVPPYESERERRQLEKIRDIGNRPREERDREFREEFLAGGGDEAEWKEIADFFDRQIEVGRQQIESGTFAACGADFFYVFKGRK